MIKPILTALCLLASCGTFLRAEGEAVIAESFADENTVYYLNVSEASTSWKSWTVVTNWSTIPKSTYQAAIDAGGIHPATMNSPDCGFVVPPHNTGFTLRNSKGKDSYDEWNGKYLQLGGMDSNGQSYKAVLRHICRGAGYYIWYKNDGLILGSKSKYMPYYANDPYAVTGTVTVTANDVRYAALLSPSRSAKNITFSFLDTFQGAQGSQFAIHSTTQNFEVIFHNTTNYFGDMYVTNIYEEATVSVQFLSDYPGSIALNTNSTLTLGSDIECNTIIVNEGSALAGGEGCTITNLTLDNVDWVMPEGSVVKNLVLQNGSIFKANANSEVETLAIDSASAIDITSGLLTVTDSITHSGKIRFVVSSFGNETESPRFSNIVCFPANSGLAKDDLEFVSANGEVLDWDEWTLKEVDGVITVEAFKAGYVTLKITDLHSWNKTGSSALTNATQWSDGKLPDNNLVDYVVKKLSGNTALRTPNTSATDDSNSFVFQGRSLTIENSYLTLENNLFVVNPLILKNGATVYYYSGLDNSIIGGTLIADDGRVTFQGNSYQTNTLAANLTGSGTVAFSGMSGANTGSSSCRFRITGDNYDFDGSVILTIPVYQGETEAKSTPVFHRNFTTLFLTQDSNLGGELPTLNRKAFTVENMCQVRPDLSLESVTLDNSNRGIFIKWVGRIAANEGQTFTIKSPLAVHGTLWKEGEGTLVLGNPAPTFGEDADGDMPVGDATNHTFRVAGGDVKITSGDAVNGLDVVFTNGAGRIVLDLDSEDGTFRTYGLRNTKATTPFAVEGDITKIPVVLDFAQPPARNTRRALFTVSASTDVDAFLSKIAIVKGEALAGMVVERSWRVNEDDDNSRTLVAKFTKVGLRIVIK